MPVFDTGKLPLQVLETVLKRNLIHDDRVIVGPRIGEDAAVLDMGDQYLVVTSDPITFTDKRLGWYAVNINANDIAVKGARPRWFIATLLLPEGKTDNTLVETIFGDLLESCSSMDVTLIGGHTEITSGIERPILAGQMMGEVVKERLVSLERIEEGDAILLTHGAAIEGTAILAAEKGEQLSEHLDRQLIDRAKKFQDDPGISVVEAALSACRTARIHGMHDPTEGGIVTALWELGQAGRCGLQINGDAIPIFPETQAFCQVFGIDPLGLIASGSLLIVVRPHDVEPVKTVLHSQEIPCTVIGEILPQREGLSIYKNGIAGPLHPYQRDELTKIP